MTNLKKIAAAVLLVGAAGAQAQVAVGNLWHVPEAVVNSATGATFANVPGTTPDVTFSVNSPFNFNASTATVGTWLASSSAFNIVQNTPGTLASLMDGSGVGTIVTFAGTVTVTNGQTFTVTHDDGLTLRIGALDVISVPGPTSPSITTVTYSGPSGNLPFSLVYSECCGGPAVLQIELPFTAAVPEPETYALMIAGFGALGWVSRRRRRA